MLSQGFGAPSLDPRTLLAEAERLASSHALLGAQERLDAVEGALGSTPRYRLIRGFVRFQLGELEAALTLLRPLVERQDGIGQVACTFLADACHHAGDRTAIEDLLRTQPGWAASPEGRLFAARSIANADPEAAVAALLPLAEGPFPDQLRRMAGFDAARLLDQQGRYREAWELARRLQRATATAFDLPRFLAPLQQQIQALREGALPLEPGSSGPEQGAAGPGGVAFIVGLPRAGTTLLEQMLDGHPAVRGIGEYQGVTLISQALQTGEPAAAPRFSPPPGQCATLRRRYLEPARRLAGEQVPWIVDKSLVSWMWLPAIAPVLPGSVYLHLQRDPRDLAVSLSLAAIRTSGSLGWVSELESIRQVLCCHRELVRLALRRLELHHRIVRYESLVSEPDAVMASCLQAMGLDLDEAVLHPERNPRTAITLSHQQVREPIHRRAIGRWQHYAWLFAQGWDDLAQD